MAYFGFHAFQSFAEGEVTPEIAHEIGVKLAEELWGDRFQVIVTTHLNTNHIHNHFCLNSVSFKDGKKYYDNHNNYALMRETSDRLCEEYSLSVLKEKKCPKSNIDYSSFYKNQVNKSNYHTTTKEDIDYAIAQAYSYNDFINILNKMKYEVINRSGKLSVRKEPYKRNIRIERAFGDDYKIANIEERIFNTQSVREPFPEVRTLNGRYKSAGKKKIREKKKVTGIRALYFHYCYLLKIYPKTKRKLSDAMKEDIQKMEQLSNEARFLSKNGIQTTQEFFSYKSSSYTKRKELKSRRAYLWKKYNKCKDNDQKQEIYIEIKEITKEVEILNKEKELIEDIETRIPKIKENIKEVENNEKGKEQEKDERIK